MNKLIYSLLILSSWSALVWAQDPLLCQQNLPAQLGAQIMVIGDSNAQSIGMQLDKAWFKNTSPDFNNLFDSEPSLHISQLHNLGNPATGFLFEFSHYGSFVIHRQFTQRYSKERWSDILEIETANREFAPGDIVIIWAGTNDNQDWNKLARHSPRWWEHFESQVKKIAKTCLNKNLDCYWIGPSRVLSSQILRNFLNQLNQSLNLWLADQQNVTYLDIFDQFKADSFTQDGFHLNGAAERNILKQLNAHITLRRGYNIEASAAQIRQCKNNNKKRKTTK